MIVNDADCSADVATAAPGCPDGRSPSTIYAASRLRISLPSFCVSPKNF
jgi:hypothetical protein